MSAPNQPIIVVKKKAGHGGHHGGAWKVAYADFVTAMMAFFLVMWLVGQSQAVKAGVGGYFRDPVVFEATGGRGVLPGADSVEEPKPQTPASAENEKQRLEAVVLHIKEGLAVEPAFEKLRDQIEFTVTPEGLRIDLIEKDDSTFFDSGSASIRGETGHVFGVIATELAKLDYKIDLEGHTDSHGYVSTERYSNWELSADRANTARRVMERNGLSAKQVTSVRGLADRQLRFPSDPFDARNRRVSILVKSPILTAAALPPAAPTASGARTSGHANATSDTPSESAPKAPATPAHH